MSVHTSELIHDLKAHHDDCSFTHVSNMSIMHDMEEYIPVEVMRLCMIHVCHLGRLFVRHAAMVTLLLLSRIDMKKRRDPAAGADNCASALKRQMLIRIRSGL